MDFSGIDAGIAPNISIDDIENDRMFLMSIVRDSSGSMTKFRDVMQNSTREFVESVKNSKSDDEILVSLTDFSSQIDCYGHKNVSDIPTTYNPYGMTKLYDAVIIAQNLLFDGKGKGYMEELNRHGVRTRGALVIFSDGEDNDSVKTANDARHAVELLKKQEILVAFIAFGDRAKGIADNIGVDPKNILETSATASELRKIWDIMSKSAVSLSKSAASGTSRDSFFTV
jgi:hypothetical protein